MIVATKDLSLWPLSAEFTSPDVAACLWKTGIDLFPEIVLISVYADINNTDAVSPELARIATYCGMRNLPCIIGADSNAHIISFACSKKNFMCSMPAINAIA